MSTLGFLTGADPYSLQDRPALFHGPARRRGNRPAQPERGIALGARDGYQRYLTSVCCSKRTSLSITLSDKQAFGGFRPPALPVVDALPLIARLDVLLDMNTLSPFP
jgi:hypothetical protein